MTLYILNMLDIIATLYALHIGVKELNPLMQNIPFMVIYKVFIVGFFCWVLNHFAEDGNMVARWGMRILTAAFAALALWHIANL